MVVNLFFNTVSLSQSPFEKYFKIFHVPLTSKNPPRSVTSAGEMNWNCEKYVGPTLNRFVISGLLKIHVRG